MSLFKWIGVGQSAKNSVPDIHIVDPMEKFIGMENFGNTCYVNSILQALYHSKAFRECVINFPSPPPMSLVASPALSSISPSFSAASPALTSTTPLTNGLSQQSKNSSSNDFFSLSAFSPGRVDSSPLNSAIFLKESLFSCLRDLFISISNMKKRTGIIAPNAFVTKLRKENELFRSTMHQDAHEFLNYLLNAIAENVQEVVDKLDSEIKIPKSLLPDTASDHSNSTKKHLDNIPRTWVHRLFEGVLTNETRCLTCETITNKDESFLDLSIDIEQHSSVTACLRQFSASELLCQRNKFHCDKCCGLQEAEKRMKIKRLPNLLALHLKRFKYQEKLQKYIKLSYRVVFPFELRLFNTAEDTDNPDRIYELYAIVVHIGAGPYHGHYIAIIKSGEKWWIFDDQNVSQIDENDIEKYYGDAGQGSGYVLFYQAIDLDLNSLGLHGKINHDNSIKDVSGDSLDNDFSQQTSNANNVLGLGLSKADSPVRPTLETIPIPGDRKSGSSSSDNSGFADRFFLSSARRRENSSGGSTGVPKEGQRKRSGLSRYVGTNVPALGLYKKS